MFETLLVLTITETEMILIIIIMMVHIRTESDLTWRIVSDHPCFILLVGNNNTNISDNEDELTA